MKFTVVRDTREKRRHGWSWGKSNLCDGTVEHALKTGDYSLMGYEHIVALERKESVSEWAKNIVEARFERELERLEEIRFPFILLEFSMEDIMKYPNGSKIPKYKWKKIRVRGPFILKKMIEFEQKYKTKIILCGEGNGKTVASSIFKKIIETIHGENISSTKSF